MFFLFYFVKAMELDLLSLDSVARFADERSFGTFACCD